MAGWLAVPGRGREVIVAHDTRFLGERMAELLARIPHEHGMHAVLARAAQRLRRRLAAGEALLGASGASPGSG